MGSAVDGWIEAGFFLVAPGRSPRENALLPSRLLTVSTCVADTYPDVWALPWAQIPAHELRRIREVLALSESGFAELCSWVRRAMDAGDFGWPNVFLSLHVAREFRKRFLGAVDGVRLVGLSLAKEVAADFVRDEAPSTGASAPGVWTALSRGTLLSHSRAPIGFDVLGAEHDGSFHTFSCNGLERAFVDELGASFTADGLIDDARKAAEASAYTNRDDSPAEPVRWYPFRVDAYPGEADADRMAP